MGKSLILSVTKKDFDVQAFRSGGPGGQNQNKVSSGVRIKHAASGAVGESRTSKSQHSNRKLAFDRLVKSRSFQRWLKWEVAKAYGVEAIAAQNVRKQMRPENLRIETFEPDPPSSPAS